jgi:hypothetical protein
MSPFKLSGKLRKEKKKELHSLKFSLKNFWFFEDIDRVMGGGMDDSSCQKIISKLESQILKLENELKEPTISIIRENRLNELEV